jgi:hypothetical protein
MFIITARIAPAKGERVLAGSSRGSGWMGRIYPCLFTAMALILCLAAPAPAAALPSFLTQMGEKGTGAGQLEQARSLVASPSTGHIYAVDSLRGEPRTNRILEFTAWGEFVRAWGWGVRNGAAELQTCGPQATPPSAACLPGLEGDGAGQLDQPAGIAMDSSGDLFVFDRANERVQKFSPDGEFILTFGGGVNQTTGGDVCTAASGDTCQAGAPGNADGQFGVENRLGSDGNYIAVGPADTVFVGDKDRIQEFEADGTFIGAIPLPEPGAPGALAADPVSGDLYFAFGQETPRVVPSPQPDVYRLDPEDGDVLGTLPVPKPIALATDQVGNAYVVLQPFNPEKALPPEVIEFDSDGEPIIPEGAEFRPALDVATGDLRSLATNTVTAAGGVDLMVGFESPGVSAIDVFGPPPDKWPPPLLSPKIDAQFAADVGTESATVEAQVNPRFWADTRYFVEYGAEPCSQGGCTQKPAPPGILLGAGIVNASITTEGIELDQLDPGTHYFFRFVSESGGGGPTIGEGEGHLEGDFVTHLPSSASTTCPNQAFRTGPSAFLPDCRAYEIVSPLDKADGDIIVRCNIQCHPVRLDQAAEAGGKLTYSAYRAFGDAQSGPYSSQYLATRGPNGWSSHGISPPQEGAPPVSNPVLDTQFKAFSADLGQAWLSQSYEPLLAPQAVPGFTNLYRLDTETGEYEALTTTKPVETAASSYEVELQGLSANGEQAVFWANGKLTGNATGKGLRQIYEVGNGSLKLVSIRPNKTPNAESATVGSSDLVSPTGRTATLHQAVSADGSRIFWSESVGGINQGRLFARIDNQETIQLSAAAEFVTANADGSVALFRTKEENLVEFDLESKAATTIGTAVVGAVAFSDDASRIYFVSTAALTGGATPGSPNLYLYERAQPLTFVATLAPADVSGSNSFAVVAPRPIKRATRVTGDGKVLVFTSQADLTGFDNTDLSNRETDAEVFRYDADDQSLLCVSCNPTGARPRGQQLEAQDVPTGFWAAAYLPGWSSQFYPSRALSSSGDRVFFNSSDALALRDRDGKQDVYEWELAGTGDCTAQTAELDPESGGCLSLISSGEGSKDAAFLDASANGSEAFFTTGEKLVPQDPGAIDVYVARVGGGFPPPPASPEPCDGEACQPVAAPPGPAPSASDAFVGPPTPRPVHLRICGRGKHRVKRHGKVRCVPREKTGRSWRRAR